MSSTRRNFSIFTFCGCSLIEVYKRGSSLRMRMKNSYQDGMRKNALQGPFYTPYSRPMSNQYELKYRTSVRNGGFLEDDAFELRGKGYRVGFCRHDRGIGEKNNMIMNFSVCFGARKRKLYPDHSVIAPYLNVVQSSYRERRYVIVHIHFVLLLCMII